MITTKPRKPRAVLPSNDPNFETNQYGVFDDTRLMIDDIGDFVDEVNNFSLDLALDLQTTSVTSNTIGTGNRTFTVGTNLGLQVGQVVNAASSANVANRMRGAIVSYDKVTGALVVAMEYAKGTGAFNAWNIALALDGGADNNLLYAVTTGTGSAYEVTFNQDLAEYNDNQTFKIKFHTDCLTNATIRYNGINPPQDLKIQNSAGQFVNVFQGDITQNHVSLALGINNATAVLVQSAIDYQPARGNRVINGNFAVNQSNVTGTVTLAAGAYGHDMYKAGAAGCTYTFATVGNVTTLTISAGSLIQVVEGLNLQTGTHVLSWTGTAQGKIGAGSFGASGITGLITGGTNTNIEFNTGTLSKVQLEEGVIPTTFQFRPIPQELDFCQRYFQIVAGGYSGPAVNGSSNYGIITYPNTLRASPTVTWLSAVFNSSFPVTASSIATISLTSFRAAKTATATIQDGEFIDLYSVSARL